MGQENNELDVVEWEGMKIVRIEDAEEGFKEFLEEKTTPVYDDDKDPFGWAYLKDYEQFKKPPVEENK